MKLIRQRKTVLPVFTYIFNIKTKTQTIARSQNGRVILEEVNLKEDAELTPPHEHIRNTCVHMWGSSHCKQSEDWQEGSPITKAVWKDPHRIR